MNKGNILIIDTTNEVLFVGLICEDGYDFTIIDDEKFSHSVKLLPTIDNLLEKHKLKINDIECVALSIGPGSFTGIRIGVSTVKAFQYAMNVKVIAVNTLEVIAYHKIKEKKEVISLIDAKHGNAYIGEYINGEEKLSFENLDSFNKRKINCQVLSNGQNAFGGKVIDCYYDNFYKIVVDKYSKGEFSLEFAPLYLKLSQAEEEENANKRMEN